MYILRENVILTLLGTITGSVLGKMLHAFIIYTSETDTMMMYPNVSITSYIISAGINILFFIIKLLRKINVESIYKIVHFIVLWICSLQILYIDHL